MEKVVQEGIEAVNRFITAGEIEQLNDIIKGKEGKNGDEPAPKRTRFDRPTNHNVQIIYKDNSNSASGNNQQSSSSSSSSSFIPPLMGLNVENPPEFRGEKHGNWQPGGSPMGFTPNGATSNTNQPPSLLNMNFNEMPPGKNWNGPSSGGNNFAMNNNNGNNANPSEGNAAAPAASAPSKRRNRDSDGNRISRFSDNERVRRPNNNTNNSGGWSKNNR